MATPRRTEADRPVCALPEGDPWMDNMLRPLIESLGYRVVAAGEGVAADIVIQSPRTSASAGSAGAGAAHPLAARSRRRATTASTATTAPP